MDTALNYTVQPEQQSAVPEPKAATVLTATDHKPMLSIILPTRNEAGNIHLLLTRIEGATRGIPTQVVFVDDSTDETAQVIQEIGGLFPLETTLIVRPAERRTDGLGGAVLEGLRAARAPWVCVMDADLQHPPEMIPRLLNQAQQSDADMVIASRRTKDSNAKRLGTVRTFISRTLDVLARMMFPANLRGITDPLTGFFLARREAIDMSKLRPNGFKILLEILVRFPTLRVTEVPFDFGARHAGKSKASPTEVGRYLSLLWSLRFGNDIGQLIRFTVVGVSGIVVNSLALAVVTDWLGVYFMVSTAFATLSSTVWNFALTEYWVFGERQRREGLVKRFAMFFFMNNIALMLRGPIIYGLTVGMNIHFLISNLISLGVLMLLRYFLADAWIWGHAKSKQAPTPLDAHKIALPAIGNQSPAE
jgi:glycosyltransferase involved in cell wall biosynthesis